MIVTRYNAKERLKRRGWTQQAAADAIGVHRVHLTYVLNGQRNSRRLLAAIANLPYAPARKGAKQ
ncbi:MAG: helix-turn-helix transcriptional regulator [Chthoniobacteraceae bacterium]|nr:helix-turn-helix transcriptional regulator [Chthoniobacteraceae bacterium]